MAWKAVIPELAYVQRMVLFYAAFAKGKWGKEGLGKRKISRLDSFTSITPEGNFSVNLWDVLDFLAENLGDDTRLEWASAARSNTKRALHLS